DTVIKVGKDTLEWAMTGDGTSPYVPTDFVMVEGAAGGDPSFKEQHDPALLPNGDLTVFDNHAPRGLELAIDESVEPHTATFIADWPVTGPCLFEGSVYPADGGHWLVTCGNTHDIWEFDENGALARKLLPACKTGLPLTTRGIPIDLW